MSKYIWLAVEADKYELPLAVAETAEELNVPFAESKILTLIHIATGAVRR